MPGFRSAHGTAFDLVESRLCVGSFGTVPQVLIWHFPSGCYHRIMQSLFDAQQPSPPQEKLKMSAPCDGPALNSGNTSPPAPALAAGAHFLRQNFIRALAISAAMLVPCFWHSRIEAGDLASHTYDAWLAQLTERGQAPGLWLAKQWNNVLFDMSLSWLGGLVGLRLAEKLCVSAAILIFFWGAFAMIGAIARRAPWSLTPCIAMFAYGWTFQQGFLNYYISLGLAFFAVALLHRGRGLERALVLVLLALAWMAHPLGVALLLWAGLLCGGRREAWIAQSAAAVYRRRLYAGAGQQLYRQPLFCSLAG